MPIVRREAAETASDNTPVYRISFVSRSHQILRMGYDRLDAPKLSRHGEEEITGELTRSMQEALQDRRAPRWAKNFWAVEETRVHEETRLGKNRLRIDIEIIRSQAGPRPRFRFEAKRLHDVTSRREYLGDDGMGCFLDGRYAGEDSIAGMLGYVQANTVVSHATALKQALKADAEKYATLDDDQWIPTKFIKAFASYRTSHSRTKGLPDIILQHTLLDFCQH